MKPLPPLLALLSMAASAPAQKPNPADRQGPPPQGPPPVLALFDTDRDGGISRAEMEAAAGVLSGLDRNGDGIVGPAEIPGPPQGARRPFPPDGGARRPERRPPPLVMALDADKDGCISAAEIQGAPAALATLDADGDGDLTPGELHPHGPPPAESGPHPQDGGGPPGPPPHDPEE